MAVKLRWETRHTFWAIIAVIVAGVMVWRGVSRDDSNRDAKPLTTRNQSATDDDGDYITIDAWKRLPMLRDFDGPKKFHAIEFRPDRTIVIQTRGSGDTESWRLLGVLCGETEAERQLLANWAVDFFRDNAFLHILRDEQVPGPDDEPVCLIAAPNPDPESDRDYGYFMLNQMVVAAGIAVVDPELPHDHLYRLFLLYDQKNAEKEKHGFWATREPREHDGGENGSANENSGS